MPWQRVTQCLFHSMLLVKVGMGQKSMSDGQQTLLEPSLEKNNQLDMVIREALSEKVVTGLSAEG